MSAEGVALTVFLEYFSSLRSSRSGGAGALGAFPLLPYFQNCEIKNTDLTLFLVFKGHTN